MITILLNDFLSSGDCKAKTYTCIDAFLEISYIFTGGKIYGFASDFGCGGWGLATCLGGRAYKNYYTGQIFLNEKDIKCDELANHSCFVSENIFSNKQNMTAKKAIEWALKQSNLDYSVKEIKEIFKLSDDRFTRKLHVVGIEIWRISMAIGFALNRKIFCFPWVSRRDIGGIEYYLEYINILKDNGAIILIPSSQESKLRNFCDNLLLFNEGEILFE